MTQAPRCGVLLVSPGAVRPENRVTARSKLPQKKCTGLTLPRNRDRNRREHPIHLHQGAPEPVDVVRVVRMVLGILIERYGVGDLDRHRPDAGLQPELAQPAHHLGVELRHRTRAQLDGRHAARRWSGSSGSGR